MKIAVGCDHRGLKLKKYIIKLLAEAGHSFKDLGCYSEESVDYPDIAREVAQMVAGGGFERGILVCSTGIGMCIAANKVAGIRAALCHDTFAAARAREHTDCNILCMGEWCIGQGIGRAIVKAFLDAEFVGGRHARRLEKIQDLEKE